MTELYATSAWHERLAMHAERSEEGRHAQVYARVSSRPNTEKVTEEKEVSMPSKGTQSVPSNAWGKRLGMRREAYRTYRGQRRRKRGEEVRPINT